MAHHPQHRLPPSASDRQRCCRPSLFSMLSGLITSVSVHRGRLPPWWVCMGLVAVAGLEWVVLTLAIMMGSTGHGGRAGLAWRLRWLRLSPLAAADGGRAHLVRAFLKRSIWTAFARRPMKSCDMNNKMADLKEKARFQAAAAAAAATAATQKTPLPALRQSSPPKPRLLRRSRLRRR